MSEKKYCEIMEALNTPPYYLYLKQKFLVLILEKDDTPVLF